MNLEFAKEVLGSDALDNGFGEEIGCVIISNDDFSQQILGSANMLNFEAA
uniref:Uncharacterized protein n=1 Tax=viral metagenome TaxID=1070528 RepID=A0A6M3M9T0_9ZZZZ